MQNDDVWAVLESFQGFDFSESGLVVVDFFESDHEIVGETKGFVDVGVGSGSDPLLDLVFGDDFGAGVDAPAFAFCVHCY